MNYIYQNIDINFDIFFFAIEEFLEFENRDNVDKQIETLIQNTKCNLDVRGLDDGYWMMESMMTMIMESIIIMISVMKSTMEFMMGFIVNS